MSPLYLTSLGSESLMFEKQGPRSQESGIPRLRLDLFTRQHLETFSVYILDHSPDSDNPIIPILDNKLEFETTTSSSSNSLPPPSGQDVDVQKYGPFCPSDKCAQGHWVPRVPRFETYEQAENAINTAYNKNGEDRGFRMPDVELEPEPVTITEEQRRERILEISNWVWKPQFGEVIPFNVEEFVLKLLKSPGGMFLVGDSLTTHHFLTIFHRISQADFKLDAYAEDGPFKGHPYVVQYNLDVNHPRNQALINMAGIPASRASRPILTHVVAHVLTTPKEMNKIFRTDWEYVHNHHFAQVEGWQDFLAEKTRPREGEVSITEDNLVIVNTGAHWSRSTLHGYVGKQSDRAAFSRKIEHGHSVMIKTMIASMASLSQTTVFFRSTSPGHSSCMQHYRPFSSIEAAKDFTEKPENNKETTEQWWDWDMFASRNEMWRAEIKKYEEERNANNWNGKGSKWVYLDFWQMDLQRADAHSGYWDCLHYIVPFEFKEWTDMIFHYLFVEERLKERQPH
ncbi:hypothetical protein D9758_014841 [Tetrapyrgos nigripes]|uniref:Uncharacterized protein n=1 Tax=Tetrapyrgos nigripes TaxID=182062 RepID=A0A8H5CV79_9AGAR|nr:hypothetical protein D9758_014841 [Tetrapyrgos nigripes]